MRCAILVSGAAWLALIVAASEAGAQSSEPTPATATSKSGARKHQALPPASEYRNLPKADEASGVASGAVQNKSTLRAIARAVFFVPKWIFYGVLWPIRQGLYLNDKYAIGSRIRLAFFNDNETFGIYPAALFETGFGLNIGGRLIHKDLFGKRERLKLRASYGGVFRQIYRASLSSGERIPDAALSLVAEYSIEPDANFFGIGNGDIDPFPTPGIDPYERDDVAARTRLRQEKFRAEVAANFDLSRWLPRVFAIPSVTYRWRTFDQTDEGVPLDQVFDPAAVVGVEGGGSSLYAELQLTYDGHKNSHREQWGDATGTRATVFAGYARGAGDDPSDFVRYGVDVSTLFDLYDGNRVLAVRGYLEGVTADRRDMPFVDLPELGGTKLLRGYDRSRFRDTIAAVATLEYQYALQRDIWIYAFVDVGRVYPRWAHVRFDDLRLGYGAGVQRQNQTGFQGRLQFATSKDGGFFFSLVLNPEFSSGARTKR